eukprot:5996523-Amphidinium_carterae.1
MVKPLSSTIRSQGMVVNVFSEIGKTPMLQALANTASRTWDIHVVDKTCCDYDQFRQEPASVDTPYLYNDSSVRWVSSKLDYRDWLCVVRDVLPVKRHAQHTTAILKRSWFVTLGKKNLYMRAPSSDVSTDILVVPHVTGFKTERLVNAAGREKLRVYEDEGVKSMPDGFEEAMTWAVEFVRRCLKGDARHHKSSKLVLVYYVAVKLERNCSSLCISY